METRDELSRRERQIIDGLSRRGEATVAELMEETKEMPDPPSYSAVRATLRTLVAKGYVAHKYDGPRYVYMPTVPPDEARESAMQHLVRTFFAGSTEEAVVSLLRSGDTHLSAAEIESLAAKIRQAANEGR